MKHLADVLSIALFVGLAFVMGWAATDTFLPHPPKSALECEAIKDTDRRHFCRAVAIPRRSECEFIKKHDLRQECRSLLP